MFLLAKYNTQTAFRFPMVKRGVVDLAATGDWTPATGDTKVSKDGGNFANTTNNPSAVGGTGSIGWTLTLTATELSAAEINVQIVDSATKAVEDQYITIYTYGNASAKIPVDLSDTVRAGLTALPNAAADGAGGLPISDAGGLDLDTLIGRLDAAISTRGTADPGDQMDLVNAPNATAVTAIQNGLATLAKLLAYVQLLARKDAAIATDNATELTAINANGGSGAGAYDNTTEAQEALRDRGDSAWITATGFSTLDAAGIRSAVGLATANLDTQLAALPTAAEIRAEIDSNSTQLAQIITDIAALNNFDPATDTVLADIRKVNNVTITGDGSVTPWGPA